LGIALLQTSETALLQISETALPSVVGNRLSLKRKEVLALQLAVALEIAGLWAGLGGRFRPGSISCHVPKKARKDLRDFFIAFFLSTVLCSPWQLHLPHSFSTKEGI
jgi:hypothetical protein